MSSYEPICLVMQVITPWANGTAAIAHCAINSGENFNYRFMMG